MINDIHLALLHIVQTGLSNGYVFLGQEIRAPGVLNNMGTTLVDLVGFGLVKSDRPR